MKAWESLRKISYQGVTRVLQPRAAPKREKKDKN